MDAIKELQDSMLESASDWYSASDKEDLRALIWAVGEFYRYLLDGDLNDRRSLRYHGDNVLATIECFGRLVDAYRTGDEADDYRHVQGMASVEALKEEFIATYREFCKQVDFEQRYGLLLRLFKLQLVFVGMTY